MLDKEGTEIAKYYAEINKTDYETVYVKADYNSEEKYYEAKFNQIISNCEQFEMLSNNANMEFDFRYQGKKYGVHYFDNKVHGNKLPSGGNVEFLTEVLKIKLEYDYQNKKVNLIIP